MTSVKVAKLIKQFTNSGLSQESNAIWASNSTNPAAFVKKLSEQSSKWHIFVIWLFVIASKEILKNEATREAYLTQMILYPLVRGKIDSTVVKNLQIDHDLIQRLQTCLSICYKQNGSMMLVGVAMFFEQLMQALFVKPEVMKVDLDERHFVGFSFDFHDLDAIVFKPFCVHDLRKVRKVIIEDLNQVIKLEDRKHIDLTELLTSLHEFVLLSEKFPVTLLPLFE